MNTLIRVRTRVCVCVCVCGVYLASAIWALEPVNGFMANAPM